MAEERCAAVERNTKETRIQLTFHVDGSGKSRVETGIGFFDHMLTGFARHGFFDLDVTVRGDLEVDCHHTVEDTGIVLGTAIAEALGDKAGIRRFGSCVLPMDDALVLAAVDLSGRPYFAMDADFPTERVGEPETDFPTTRVGEMETETVREFFYAVATSARMNLHLRVLAGQNSHHMIEALFKAFAKALDEATSGDPRISDVLSTKGTL